MVRQCNLLGRHQQTSCSSSHDAAVPLQLARDGSAVEDMASAAAADSPQAEAPPADLSSRALPDQQQPQQQMAAPHTPDSPAAPAQELSTFAASFQNQLFQPSLAGQHRASASLAAAPPSAAGHTQGPAQPSTVQLLEQLTIRVQQALAAAGSVSEPPADLHAARAEANAAADEWQGAALMSQEQLQQAGIALQEELPSQPQAPRTEEYDEWAGAQLMSTAQLRDAGVQELEPLAQPGFQQADSETLAGLPSAQVHPAHEAEPMQQQQHFPIQHTSRLSRPRGQATAALPPPAQLARQSSASTRAEAMAASQRPLELLQQAQKLALDAQQLHQTSLAAAHRLRQSNQAPVPAQPVQLPQAPLALAAHVASPAGMPPQAQAPGQPVFHKLPLHVGSAASDAYARPQNQQQQQQQQQAGPANESIPMNMEPLVASTMHVYSEAEARLAASKGLGVTPEADAALAPGPDFQLRPAAPTMQTDSGSQPFRHGLENQPETSLSGNAPPLQAGQPCCPLPRCMQDETC